MNKRTEKVELWFSDENDYAAKDWDLGVVLRTVWYIPSSNMVLAEIQDVLNCKNKPTTRSMHIIRTPKQCKRLAAYAYNIEMKLEQHGLL